MCTLQAQSSYCVLPHDQMTRKGMVSCEFKL